MEVAKARLEVAFQEPLAPWASLRGLVRGLALDEEAELQGQPVTITRNKTKQAFVIGFKEIDISTENVPAKDSGTSALIDLYEEVATALRDVPAVKSWKHSLTFIDTDSQPFHQLVDRFRGSFLVDNELVSHATDVGIILEYVDGAHSKVLQFGPMTSQQLQTSFLRWPFDVGDHFNFVLASVSDGHVDSTIDTETFKRSLSESVSWESHSADLAFRILHMDVEAEDDGNG